ncbi:MAG: copper chaperone PCu(A)C [Methylotenera sp.]|nr:copper chaperone PCu(A)C [Methylotenera sp.]
MKVTPFQRKLNLMTSPTKSIRTVFKTNNLMMKSYTFIKLNFYALFLLISLCASNAQALDAVTNKELVSIINAWVRPTNPGQDVGVAYMTFLSAQDTTLVNIQSDITSSIEIHNMTMENGVMKMRMLDKLDLKAGKPYKLAPGGFHLMLFDLKKPLTMGEEVKFVLTFKMKNKALFKQSIIAKVQTPN